MTQSSFNQADVDDSNSCVFCDSNTDTLACLFYHKTAAILGCLVHDEGKPY